MQLTNHGLRITQHQFSTNLVRIDDIHQHLDYLVAVALYEGDAVVGTYVTSLSPSAQGGLADSYL